ncbi:MAG TPA: ABC transporter substrate-binding protein [Thermoplasmata archaeon]|nr:ABC transporter substrate-binding protein [Thermoplasmata archaeon]
MAVEAPKPRKISIPLVVAIVVILILGGALGWALLQLGTPAQPLVTYPIGLAIAVSGPAYQSDGPIRRDAAQLAIDQMNTQLQAAGSPIRFQGVPEDTQGTTAGAQQAFTLLRAAGVQVVVGPLSTGEATGILTFINTNHIVAISPSSTGVTAAIPNDFLFRAPPTDIPQAKALSQLVSELGYTKVAIIYRLDDYGRGFEQLFEQRFETVYGGQTLNVSYDPSATDLATEVGQLSGDVQALGVGPNTAVLVVAFEVDGIEIFNEARLDTSLSSVRWFGSESMRRSAFLNRTARPQVVDFVRSANLTGFFASPSLNPVSMAFEQAYTAKYPSRDPKKSPYSYYAYDSAMLAMMAVLAAGKYDGDAIKAMVPFVAQTYMGASGHKAMDANGDAIAADYVAWHVALNAMSVEYFAEFARWRFATETLEFYP